MIVASDDLSIYIDSKPDHSIGFFDCRGRYHDIRAYENLLTADFEAFAQSPARNKISLVRVRDQGHIEQWATTKLPDLLAVSDRIYLFALEGHCVYEPPISSLLDNEKLVILAVDGPRRWQNAQFVRHYPWLTRTWYVNCVLLPERLQQLHDQKQSPELAFDCLMGGNRILRTRFYNQLEAKGLINKGIVRYQTDPEQSFWNYFQFDDLYAHLDGSERSIKTSVNHVNKNDLYHLIKDLRTVDHALPWKERDQYQSVSISTVIDTKVYAKTGFSIINESSGCFRPERDPKRYPDANITNQIYFFTEKTAKPIVAKRMFLLVAASGSLKKLQDLGFQTFGSVIDESYDLVPNYDDRIAAITDVVSFLCQSDLNEILRAVQPIVEHNFHRLAELRHYEIPGGLFREDLGTHAFSKF